MRRPGEGGPSEGFQRCLNPFHRHMISASLDSLGTVKE